MSKSNLTLERLRELFHYSPLTGLFWRIAKTNNQIKQYSVAGSLDTKGRYQIKIDGRLHFSHRLAWLYIYGVWPNNQIDHINGDHIDNRISNLRDVTNAVNQQNRRRPQKGNSSGFIGVSRSRCGKKWVARINIDGNIKNIGTYSEPHIAYEAYVAIKRIHHEGNTL